jgi:hypothetical protein
VLRPGLLRRLLRVHGGFTIDPRSGRPVGRGISVCADPDLALSLAGWDDGAVTRWLAAHAASYRRPGFYVGGWTDPASGRVWLDVVRLLPAALLRIALEIARVHEQRGVFDLARGQLVLVGAT